MVLRNGFVDVSVSVMPSIEAFKHDPSALQLGAGQTVFEEGAAGNEMYVVVAGEVELRLGDRLLDVAGPGQMFGEMALVDHVTRSASAITRTAATIVPVDRRRFLYLIQNTPYFAIEVMKTMADRLRRMDARK